MSDIDPYRPPAAELSERGAAAPSFRPAHLASRTSRLGAAIIDGLCLAVIVAPLGIAYVMLTPEEQPPNYSASDYGTAIAIVATLGLPLATYQLVQLHRRGQTLGKKLLRIRIVRSSGEPVSLVRVLALRGAPFFALSLIPAVGRLASLLDALAIFQPSHRCLHDLVADTIVVEA